MEDWIKKIHLQTLSKYGPTEMFKKLISELFELKLEIDTPAPSRARMEEEIADILNMHDKMILAGYKFDFANHLNLDETIKFAHLAFKLEMTDVAICIPVLANTIISDQKLDRNNIIGFQISKMKRTKQRLEEG